MSRPPAGSPATTPGANVRTARSAIAQILGRNLIALARLALVSLIIRRFGPEVFGDYSFLLVLFALAEWVLDFGTSDVFTRDICQRPEEHRPLMRQLLGLRAVQLPLALLFLAGALVALKASATVAAASLFGALSLAFMAMTLCFRVELRVRLHPEREVAAELVSVFVMGIALWQIANRGGGLVEIIAAHAASRLVLLTLCAWWTPGGLLRGPVPEIRPALWDDVRRGFRSIWAIGLIGFIVLAYETMDILLLSRVGTSAQVACFAGAQRFVWPVLTSLTAVGSTMFPVLANAWTRSSDEFRAVFQRSLDAVSLFAGLAACALAGGSPFLTAVLGGNRLTDSSDALRILAGVCLAKAVSTTSGPVLYAVHHQNAALRFVILGLMVKAAALLTLIPRFGCHGSAYATLAADSVFAAISIYMAQRYSSSWIRWRVPVRSAVFAAVAVAVPSSAGLPGAAALFVSPGLFAALTLVTGTMSRNELTAFFKRSPQ